MSCFADGFWFKLGMMGAEIAFAVCAAVLFFVAFLAWCRFAR